jgi:hypothetical protein
VILKRRFSWFVMGVVWMGWFQLQSTHALPELSCKEAHDLEPVAGGSASRACSPPHDYADRPQTDSPVLSLGQEAPGASGTLCGSVNIVIYLDKSVGLKMDTFSEDSSFILAS